MSGAGALRGLGVHIAPPVLDIALPLGISFFTFQGIAYLVHVAAGETPFRRATDFLLFKAFWPQLIAGPIIRPGEIEAQITGTRTLSYPDVAAGLQRIAHGCFKKVVLADLLAPYVDAAFLPGANPAAIDCAAGMLGFGLQIYFDFSGYSDIAIGSARLFGFTFPENFDWPYAARSPQEFWNRWHMTLSRWIRDYLFTPLSFAARRHPRVAHIWLLLAMALCGLWHGAEWTFVLWGLWHGALLVLGQTWLKGLFRLSPGDGFRAGLVNAGRCGLTFGLVTLGWLLFRSQSVAQVGDMLHALLTLRGGLRPAVLRENALMIIGAVFLGSLAARWLASSRIVGLATGNARWASAARGLYYALLVIATVIFDREARAFVYFQF